LVHTQKERRKKREEKTRKRYKTKKEKRRENTHFFFFFFFLDHHGDDDSDDTDNSGDDGASGGGRRVTTLVGTARSGETIITDREDGFTGNTAGEEVFVVVAEKFDTGGTVSAVDGFEVRANGEASSVEVKSGLAVEQETFREGLGNILLSRNQNLRAAVGEDGEGDEAADDHLGEVAAGGETVGHQGLVDEGPGRSVDGEATFRVPGGGEADFEVVTKREAGEVGTDGGGFFGVEGPDHVPGEGTSGLLVGVDDDEVVSGSSNIEVGVSIGSHNTPTRNVGELGHGDDVTLNSRSTARGSSDDDGGLTVDVGGQERGNSQNENKSELGDHFFP